MFKFKQVKYLLLALTTLYTPVTRNAIQMTLCAPKYAYAKYACYLNNTDQLVRKFYASPREPEDTNTCVEEYMFVAKASDFQGTSDDYMVITEKTCSTFTDDTIKTLPITSKNDCRDAATQLKPPNYEAGSICNICTIQEPSVLVQMK